MRNRVYSLLLFLVFFILSLGFFLKLNFVNPYKIVCDLVYNSIYIRGAELDEFYTRCNFESKKVTLWTPNRNIIGSLSFLFETLNVSHLQIFTSEENEKIWKGKSFETGIEAKFMDGELVVTNVDKGSSADSLGIERGDIIVRINNEEPNEVDARNSEGVFLVHQKNQMNELNLKNYEYIKDEQLKVFKITEKTALLRISTFRKDFFLDDELIRIQNELFKYKKVIIDLRGNTGGNFVAGLRLLSLFFCGEQEIGYLNKPKASFFKESFLPNDMNEENQIRIMSENSLIHMKTFDLNSCLPLSTAVLVDHESGSTAEMVAQAFKDYQGAKILGEMSAGALLQGVWYDLPELGRGTMISIPEALYQTKRGIVIEGGGVKIDKALDYRFKDFEKGQDSWVLQALDLF